MFIAAVLCLCAAVVTAGIGLRLLWAPASGDPAHSVLRSVAPTQLAAAAMLAAGGVVGLAAPAAGPVVLFGCLLGAVGTVAAGSWQSAKAAAAMETVARAEAGDCGSACASCTLPCN